MTEYDSHIKTPVGRFLDGSFVKSYNKDFYGNETEKPYFWAHIGFEKRTPEFNEISRHVQFIAQQGFPELFKNDSKPAAFSWKIIDGDSRVPNKKGSIYAEKEGYPGNYIFKFVTYYPLKICNSDAIDVTEDEKYIKIGDYVRILGSVTSNKSKINPGIYLNMNRVQHVRSGPEIVRSSSDEFDKVPQGAFKIDDTKEIPLPPQLGNIKPADDILDKYIPKRYSYNGSVYTEQQLKSSGWKDSDINSLELAN